MAEYIDREALLEQIDNRVNAFYDEEMNIKDMCVQLTENAPTEDVVPKSEVEEIVKFKDMAYAELKSLFIEAEQEVAKQIFEEIEKLQNPQGAVWLFTSNYIELKKKYIGE